METAQKGKKVCRVHPANGYRPGQLSSIGSAENMLIRQWNFPDIYQRQDTFLEAWSDRLIGRGGELATACFKRHTERESDQLEWWLRDSAVNDTQVMNFLADLFKTKEKWTGYRITGSVNQGNGQTVWLFTLFRQHQDSKDPVYTGDQAPNVLP